MSTTTTNYGLTKLDLTDAADITTLNQNWNIIDETLKTVDTNLQSVNDDLQSVNDDLQDVSQKIQRLAQTEIVLIEGTDYGTDLPTTGVKGQLFFKKV